MLAVLLAVVEPDFDGSADGCSSSAGVVFGDDIGVGDFGAGLSWVSVDVGNEPLFEGLGGEAFALLWVFLLDVLDQGLPSLSMMR